MCCRDRGLFLPEEALELSGQQLDQRANTEDVHPLRSPQGVGEMERETGLGPATLYLESISH